MRTSASNEKRVDEMFRATLIVPMLIGALTCTGAFDYVPEPDLAGVYVCRGNNADGSQYQAIVEIVRQNGAFVLVWYSDREIVAAGLGVRIGNVLAVSYYAEPPGVVAYRIEENNRLVGEWTVVGADGALFSEMLTKVPAAKLGPSVIASRPKPARARPGDRPT
jgi:hypothetical protein